jgi:hypothetical protein
MNDFKLIAKGSSGCVFSPMIPCSNKSKKKSKNKKSKKNKSLTKLLFENDIREINYNKKVEKIKDYHKWTVLWDDLCLSKKMKELNKYKEFRNCIGENSSIYKLSPKEYRFILLQGYYNGISLDETFKDTSKDVLLKKDKFIDFFLHIFELLTNVFYGIKQLNRHHICHHDITSRNILVKGDSSYLIDYDISVDVNKSTENDTFIQQRMDEEIKYSRLYEIYPFEYYYHRFDDKNNINKEIDDIHRGKSSQINYLNLYKPIQDFFNIDEKNLRLKLLQSKLDGEQSSAQEIMEKLDVYSVGMTILIFFIDLATNKNIDYRIILNHMRSPKLKNHMNLIRNMIQFNHTERISPEVAYKRYLKLIRKKKTKKKSKKKTLK